MTSTTPSSATRSDSTRSGPRSSNAKHWLYEQFASRPIAVAVHISACASVSGKRYRPLGCGHERVEVDRPECVMLVSHRLPRALARPGGTCPGLSGSVTNQAAFPFASSPRRAPATGGSPAPGEQVARLHLRERLLNASTTRVEVVVRVRGGEEPGAALPDVDALVAQVRVERGSRAARRAGS